MGIADERQLADEIDKLSDRCAYLEKTMAKCMNYLSAVAEEVAVVISVLKDIIGAEADRPDPSAGEANKSGEPREKLLSEEPGA